jgi:anti-sigma28 factor (negative regulator of flagellin synthesis)
MKINDVYTSSQAAATYQSQTQKTEAAQSVSASKVGANKSSGGSDEVNLSSLANVLQDAITESPEKTAYLEKLAAQYAAGTYQADPQAVAKSLIGETLADKTGGKGGI